MTPQLLLNYQRLHGLNTVRKIINRFAPPNENDTGAYVNAVSKALNVGPDEAIAVEDRLHGLVRAIIKHENGFAWSNYYSDQQIDEGIRRALA